MAKLIGKRGLLLDTRLDLIEGEEWTIGRDPEEATLIVEDPAVSRQHAIITQTPQGFAIENLSETNPVLVNDQEIPEAYILTEGDELKIGDTYFSFSEEEETYETLFEAEPPKEMELQPSGRWLIKVVGGPNTGAEFSLQTDRSYLIGTDAASCDILFHDLSVSRQHARLSVGKDETLSIEDLHSRNGVVINGNLIEEPSALQGNATVAVGTTSFVVIDREAAMETIFAVPPPEEEKLEAPAPLPLEAGEKKKEKPVLSGGAFILLLVAISIVVIAVAGTLSLFKTDEVVMEHRDYNSEIEQALVEYTDVRYSFNRPTGKLFLLGHVLTPVEKNELLYKLDNLNFIAVIDDNVVVDQYIWEEYNALISHNPEWKGVSLHSPSPGLFVMSGYLQTQAQAAALEDYMRLNFSYLDQLQNQVVVEELLTTDIISKLKTAGFAAIKIDVSNGEVTLTGYINKEEARRFENVLDQIKEDRGVRLVHNFVVLLAKDGSVIDITNRFEVEGSSRTDGQTVNVLINGKIVSRGDLFDGMEVISITSNTIILEKNGVKYKIRYNQ